MGAVGIVDVAVRHTNKEGPTQAGLTKMTAACRKAAGASMWRKTWRRQQGSVVLENRFRRRFGYSAVNAAVLQLAHVGLQGP